MQFSIAPCQLFSLTFKYFCQHMVLRFWNLHIFYTQIKTRLECCNQNDCKQFCNELDITTVLINLETRTRQKRLYCNFLILGTFIALVLRCVIDSCAQRMLTPPQHPFQLNHRPIKSISPYETSVHISILFCALIQHRTVWSKDVYVHISRRKITLEKYFYSLLLYVFINP
jgi:hypothetical protein